MNYVALNWTVTRWLATDTGHPRFQEEVAWRRGMHDNQPCFGKVALRCRLRAQPPRSAKLCAALMSLVAELKRSY